MDEWKEKEKEKERELIYVTIYICADPDRKGHEDIHTYKPQS